MIAASKLREGMALRIDGQVYKVLEAESRAGGGQAGGTVSAKLRNVTSGRMWEPHFRPDERLEDLELERQPMDFLYREGNKCIFMSPDTYEQIEVPAGILGPSGQFMTDGFRIVLESFEGRPVSAILPPFIELKVAETAPPAHSGQDSTWKKAMLENGVQIQLPLFVASGETVRIDLKTGRYMERVRAEKKKSA